MTTVGEMRTKVDLFLEKVTLIEGRKRRLCKCCDRRLVIRTKQAKEGSTQ